MKLFVPIVKLQHIDNKKTANEFLQMLPSILLFSTNKVDESQTKSSLIQLSTIVNFDIQASHFK